MYVIIIFTHIDSVVLLNYVSYRIDGLLLDDFENSSGLWLYRCSRHRVAESSETENLLRKVDFTQDYNSTDVGNLSI